MHVWTEPPKAYDPSVRACVRRLLGVKHVSGVDAADAAVFIIDGPLSSRLRAASDYVLTAPRFKDRVLTIAVGILDDVPWILQRLAFYDMRGDSVAAVAARVEDWLWCIKRGVVSGDLARSVDAVVPYVQATLEPHSVVTTSHPDWVAVHAGRARSSVVQLEGLRTMARVITDGPELSKLAAVLADANPRADLPPGQRRTQVARRKQATRRRG